MADKGEGEHVQGPCRGRHRLPPLPPMPPPHPPRTLPLRPQPILPYKIMETIDIQNVEMEVADAVVLQALDANRDPTHTEIVKADCLFTSMINYLYARLSVYHDQSDLHSICLFNINRVIAAKTWLLIYLFHFKNNFYVPTKPYNETDPPLDLEKVPCFPHLNPKYSGKDGHDLLNLLHVSKRLELFLTNIIAKLYPLMTPDEVDKYAFSYIHDVLVLSQLPDLNKLMIDLEAAKAAKAAAAAAEQTNQQPAPTAAAAKAASDASQPPPP